MKRIKNTKHALILLNVLLVSCAQNVTPLQLSERRNGTSLYRNESGLTFKLDDFKKRIEVTFPVLIKDLDNSNSVDAIMKSPNFKTQLNTNISSDSIQLHITYVHHEFYNKFCAFSNGSIKKKSFSEIMNRQDSIYLFSNRHIYITNCNSEYLFVIESLNGPFKYCFTSSNSHSLNLTIILDK